MPKEEKSTPTIAHERAGSVQPSSGGVQIDAGSGLASAALIGVGLLVEPELLGGALLAAGAIYGVPLLGRVLRPAVRTAIRAGYSVVSTVGEAVTEAGESVQDMVAEARADYQQPRSSIIKPETSV